MKGLKTYKNIFNNRKKHGSASFGAADPFILKVNGYYYLTCTRTTGLVVMKSFDLIHWEDVNDNHSIVGIDDTLHHAYAPEIYYHNGSFYACASPSGWGHYFYKSDSIEGPFERISENFNELIDGSFFVDSDEERYFLRATETGIAIKHFKNKESESDFKYFDKYHYFENSEIGNWTEGPYLIKRYGYYYLTYTGTHFLSNAYRVNYSSGTSISHSKSLKHQDLLLISTDEDFYGLGHSMSVLGPNLDSYYIVYHNMCPNKKRYLNLSRLMFDKKGHMLVNGISINDNPMFSRPLFETFINRRDYLSEQRFENDSFTIEYNFKSDDIILVLGYKDETNYQCLRFDDDKIILDTIKNNILSSQVLYNFKFKYDFNKYHNLRLQYKNQRMALYFDLIELNDNIKVKINKGKIGFKNNELENAYLAYNNVSFGESDIEDVKVDNLYIDNMFKNKNHYSTKFLIKEDGYYNFYLDKVINGEINNVSIDGVLLDNNYSSNRFVNKVYLKRGVHGITLDINKNTFNLISYRKIEEFVEIDGENFFNKLNLIGSYLPANKGIYWENDRNTLLTNNEYEEYVVESDVEVVGNPILDQNVAGIVADVINYGKNLFEGVYSLRGYMLLINRKYAYVVDANFHHSKVLHKIALDEEKTTYKLKIIKTLNSLRFLIDNIEIYKVNKPSRYLLGKVGLYMNHASVFIRTFNLKQKEENLNEEQ